MDTSEARLILERLMEGIHPTTGELLPEDHVCNDVQVVRALYKAIAALRSLEPVPATAETHAPPCGNANQANGKLPWSEEEDAYLQEACAAKLSLSAMSVQLKRSEHSVKCRLVYLDLASREILGSIYPPGVGREHRGLPWYPEEDAQLTRLFQQDVSIREIASYLKRTPNGILSRLEKLGCIENRKAYLNRNR